MNSMNLAAGGGGVDVAAGQMEVELLTTDRTGEATEGHSPADGTRHEVCNMVRNSMDAHSLCLDLKLCGLWQVT